jgi:hypothetical protein
MPNRDWDQDTLIEPECMPTWEIAGILQHFPYPSVKVDRTHWEIPDGSMYSQVIDGPFTGTTLSLCWAYAFETHEWHVTGTSNGDHHWIVCRHDDQHEAENCAIWITAVLRAYETFDENGRHFIRHLAMNNLTMVEAIRVAQLVLNS